MAPGPDPFTDGEADPVTALRTTLAVVTATIQNDHRLAASIAADLPTADARFGVLVLAEYLATAVDRLAGEERGRAATEEFWQHLCLSTEDAIRQAGTR